MVFLMRRANTRKAMKIPPRRSTERASNAYPSKLLADARYISQTMKLGALGVPSYRSFSLEELEAATNNFESSSFLGEGSHGQMYRGKLNDGCLVAIRCLKFKRRHSSQNFNRHIELISKLRYRHLVSALGHCFEYYLDDSTVSRLFLVFEYVSNGTLRNNVSGDGGQKLTWTQRISAAIGVAKGMQFLHAGILPGLFSNDLKATNILVDQNLAAKISSYNLPVLTENMKNEVVSGISSNGLKEHSGRAIHGSKVDIHDFGVILLEIITGKPITLHIDVEMMKDQLRASMASDGAGRKVSMVDPLVYKGCCKESLKTVIEVCAQCLSKEPTDRPSVEDVLWNLQFATQVQDAWRGDSHSSEGSPITL
ncbi:putative inactive leucine-rich repeat receptor-like protein kinase isoform X2 [Iris pallida]|uniref:Inactive leucine-rich repeat receptor-like protein kinase isoform X2 n=1 Tax=Iris pallida TaxID=29817 RepID=A0AAX6EB74_IRIPA|nr:putative inactive leucine-rich repeat receptor-like protein kinase isoform X2 [Iris pallida]